MEMSKMVNMTHNENIKAFNNIVHRLKLEVEHLKVAKLDRVFMAESSSCKASGFKHNGDHKYNKKGKGFDPDQKKPNDKKCPKGKHAGKKKDKSKVRCYNYSKLGHFDREYTEPKNDETDTSTWNEAYSDPIQVSIRLVTRARAKKFKKTLSGLVQATWSQSNSWRPIEGRKQDI